MPDPDELHVQIIFCIDDPDSGLPFRSALYYPLSSWPVPDAQIEADKQQRYEDWKAATATPVTDPTDPTAAPTADERAAEAAGLAQQAAELASRAQAIADGLTAEASATPETTAADGGI